MPIKSGVDGYVVDILLVEVSHDPVVRLVVACDGVPVSQELVARETGYLDSFP